MRMLQCPEELYKSLWLFVSDEEDRALQDMAAAAEIMAKLADTPQDIAFANAVNAYRKAKKLRDHCAKMIAGLDAIDPEK